MAAGGRLVLNTNALVGDLREASQSIGERESVLCSGVAISTHASVATRQQQRTRSVDETSLTLYDYKKHEVE